VAMGNKERRGEERSNALDRCATHFFLSFLCCTKIVFEISGLLFFFVFFSTFSK